MPEFYQVSYRTTGEIKEIRPVDDWVAMPVIKRVVADMDQTDYPKEFIVPYLEVVHDRAVVEVMRGCTGVAVFAKRA